MKPGNATEELERFLDRSTEGYYRALLATAEEEPGSPKHERALSKLADLILWTQRVTDITGRYHAFRAADYAVEQAKRKGRGARFAEFEVAEFWIPDADNPGTLPFTEAVEKLLRREPRLARGWRATAEAWTKDNAFALARSESEEVTKRVQKEVSAMLAGGSTPQEIHDAVQNIGDSAEMGAVRNWTRAYTETAYQTIAASSFNHGRFEQAKDPDVREMIPALMMVGVDDDRERPNHAAADGMIATVDSPYWTRLKPPLGYRCRHSADFVTRFDLERMGRLRNDGSVIEYIPPGVLSGAAHPDKGFNPG